MLSLHRASYIKKHLLNYILLSIVFFFYQFFFKSLQLYIIIFAGLHILIIARLIYLAIVPFFRTNKLNIFYIVLIFYELTLLTKVLNLFSFSLNSMAEYDLTNLFEIMIGVFFLIYREDEPKLIIHYK
jgi:hypothetical protein